MSRFVWALLKLEPGQSVENLDVQVVSHQPVGDVPEELGAPEDLLDTLEEQALETGRQVARDTFARSWSQIEQGLVADYVASAPAGEVWRDGIREVRVVTRAGVLRLARQLCYDRRQGEHCFPGNAALPPHHGEIFTRGAEQLACLLAPQFSSGITAQLFGYLVREEKAISARHVGDLAREHGQRIRTQAAEAVGKILAAGPTEPVAPLRLQPWHEPRRDRAWRESLDAVVKQALARGEWRPPQGISVAAWERVHEYCRPLADAAGELDPEDLPPLDELARLGPKIPAGEVVLSLDDVLVRAREKKQHHQVMTAHVATAEGWRCITGVGDECLAAVKAAVIQLRRHGYVKLTVLADGAKWIRGFYREELEPLWTTQGEPESEEACPSAKKRTSEMVLCWWHLQHKCQLYVQRMFRQKEVREPRWRALKNLLWKGEVAEVLRLLQQWRSVATSRAPLEELRDYLNNRLESLPNYRQRYSGLQYIASSVVEKQNDLLVARREKGRSLHWSLDGADALVALNTLMTNGEWATYWKPPPAVAVTA